MGSNVSTGPSNQTMARPLRVARCSLHLAIVDLLASGLPQVQLSLREDYPASPGGATRTEHLASHPELTGQVTAGLSPLLGAPSRPAGD